jgi:hypothetical protein
MPISFDPLNKIINITSPTTIVTVQELIDAIRDWEDSAEGIVHDKVVDGFGKARLNADVTTGIVLSLSSEWQIEFWTGVDQGFIQGGTLVGGVGGKPVKSNSIDTIVVTMEVANTIATTSTDQQAGLFGLATVAASLKASAKKTIQVGIDVGVTVSNFIAMLVSVIIYNTVSLIRTLFAPVTDLPCIRLSQDLDDHHLWTGRYGNWYTEVWKLPPYNQEASGYRYYLYKASNLVRSGRVKSISDAETKVCRLIEDIKTEYKRRRT